MKIVNTTTPKSKWKDPKFRRKYHRQWYAKRNNKPAPAPLPGAMRICLPECPKCGAKFWATVKES